MPTLRDKIIRLAHTQPAFRAPLLAALHEADRVPKQAMMPVNSVSDGIEQGCLALANDLRTFLAREYAGDMEFSKPTLQQPRTGGFEATIVNHLSEKETGYLALNVSFRNGRELILEAFGNYPRGAQLPRRSFTLGLDVTASQMASKYGPALVSTWRDPFLMDAQTTGDR